MDIKEYFKNVPKDEIDINLIDHFLKRCAFGYEKSGVRLKDWAKTFTEGPYRPLSEANKRLTYAEMERELCEPYLLDAMYYVFMEIMWRRKERYDATTSKEVKPICRMKQFGKEYDPYKNLKSREEQVDKFCEQVIKDTKEYRKEESRDA